MPKTKLEIPKSYFPKKPRCMTLNDFQSPYIIMSWRVAPLNQAIQKRKELTTKRKKAKRAFINIRFDECKGKSKNIGGI